MNNFVFGFIVDVFHVDNVLNITTKDRSDVVKFKALLNAKFKMKNLGLVKKILDVEITRDLEHDSYLVVMHRR